MNTIAAISTAMGAGGIGIIRMSGKECFDILDKIFEPFFTTKITGVGLGLANVKRIIKDHRGKIWAFNRDEGGAEFVIKIPLPSLEQKVVINDENI